MIDDEARGRALAARARSGGDLSPDEAHDFGGWLLDVMSRLMVVQDDRVVDVELRRLAREAFYVRTLKPEEFLLLGRWVERDLDNLRQRDRRTAGNSVRRPGGRRASDAEDYSPIRSVHLQELDSYFGISRSLNEAGCEHGYKPAKTCPDPACKGRRAQFAWDSVT